MATKSLSILASATKNLVSTGKKTTVADVMRLARAGAQGLALRGSKSPLAERLPAPKENAFVVSQEEKDALTRVVELIEALPGQELPTDVRELTAQQRAELVSVFNAAKVAVKPIDRAVEGIRTLVLNDQTARLERTLDSAELDLLPRDKNGWIVKNEKLTAPGETSTLSIEGKGGQVTLTPEALKAVSEAEEAQAKAAAEAGEEYTPLFSHKDYLACTTQVRVVNPDGVLSLLKGKPEAIEVLGDAAAVANPSVSLNRR